MNQVEHEPVRSTLPRSSLQDMVRADRKRRRDVRRRLSLATDALAAADLLLGLRLSLRCVGSHP